jgi:hypothetical protein
MNKGDAMHKLALTTLIGLALSATSAAAFDNRPECAPVAGAGATSRILDWDGSDGVGLALGGQATYTRGSDDKVHASGDPQVLAHLQVHDGEIRLDCRDGHFDTSHLLITLPGRAFKAFGIAGTGDLDLHKLDQPSLHVSIAGKGSVKGEGRVADIHISIAGTGNVDLGQVENQTTKVNIAGHGDADIAPRQEADVSIVGSGNVNLHTKPAKLKTSILGSGHINNLATGG